MPYPSRKSTPVDAPFQPGDTAACRVDWYSSMPPGRKAVVLVCRRYSGSLRGEQGQWVIEVTHGNGYTGAYFARNFDNLSRETPLLDPPAKSAITASTEAKYGTRNTPMQIRHNAPAIAVLLVEEGEDFGVALDRVSRKEAHTRSANTYSALSDWLRHRIASCPGERWLILTPAVVAATNAPPVVFTTL